jgi:hypothetical protein
LLLLPEELVLLFVEAKEVLCGSVVLGELARFLPRIVCMMIYYSDDVAA